jgi:threonine dehydrogenase-like Zn-dependent dehydrogenase
MKRLLITGPRSASFDDAPLPVCPDDGLVVRARVTAVSTGTEIRVYRAIPVDDAGRFLHERIPFVLPTENGYSMVGEVVEVGPRVAGFAIGERVFVPAPHKEFAGVAVDRALKLPDGLPDEQAVFLNILEVGHIALRRGNPSPGENVAIVGQGVIGLAVLAYCRAFGFRTIAVDHNPHRLSVAAAMGADLVLDARADGFLEQAAAFCGGEGADLVIEAASVWPAVETAMHLARPGGTVVVASRHTDQPAFNPVGHPFLGKTLTLLTSYGHQPDGQRWDRRRSFALTLDLLARQKLNFAAMITHRLQWNQLPDVYRELDEASPQALGVVLKWS